MAASKKNFFWFKMRIVRDDIFQIGYSVIINISYFGVGSCYTMSSVILAALQKPDAEFFVSKEAGSWIGKTKNNGSR